MRAIIVCSLVCFVSTAAAQDKQPRGYSIPLLDLAEQKERQIIVDREKGQYLGHPTTFLFEDGKTMLIVYPKGHGKGAIVMKRSTDAGLTWSERLPTPANWATSQEVPTLYRTIDPKGHRHLVLFSGIFPIRMAHSPDDGKTWGELKAIGDFGGTVAMASLERLKNGNYMGLFHTGAYGLDGKKREPREYRVYKCISKDGGLTWGGPTVIAEKPGVWLCEPGLIRSPDGKQIAVLLRDSSRKHNSHVIFSDDEGETWTKPRELPGSLTGDRHTGRYTKDGRLFISFRDMALESKTKGDWVAWVGRYDDIVKGREGQYRVRLMKNHKGSDCAYPPVEVLSDDTIVTTTYGHWTSGEMPYIVSVRLKLAELDRMVAK